MARPVSCRNLCPAAYSLAITLVFAVGVPLTIATGWRFFFGTLAAGTMLMALIVLIFVRNNPREVGFSGFTWGDDAGVERRLGFAEVFRSRWIAIGAAGIAACTFAIAGTATWVVPGFIARQGMPVEYAPTIGTLMGLSQVAFRVWGGYVADRVEKTTVIKLGAVLAIITALLFTASMIYELPFGVPLALAGVSGMGVFGGGGDLRTDERALRGLAGTCRRRLRRGLRAAGEFRRAVDDGLYYPPQCRFVLGGIPGTRRCGSAAPWADCGTDAQGPPARGAKLPGN